MRTNKLLDGIIIIIALITFSCKEKKKEPTLAKPAGAQPIRAEAFIVLPAAITENIETPGSLLPYESTELHTEVSGRVVSINFKEGGYVNKGALLVKLFDDDLQAQLHKLNVQLQIAEKTLERQQELLKINGISQQEVDLSSLQVSNIKADIELLKTNIGKTQLRAPFNGRIGLRNISLGAYITPQTVISSLQQIDNLKMEFSVPEKYGSKIKEGMEVSFSIQGSLRKYQAKIIATENMVNETSRSLKVKAVVMQKDKAILPGVFAKVILNFGQNSKALLIPTQAIIPQARNKKVIIYRNGIAKFEIVETGLRDSARIEVISGLKTGDTIITTGLLAIKPEGKVTISKINNKN
ncbi:MAG TPA: efflux RND transporter periplasmic adaptor subunit [Chitinophagaceae bacterium]|nr:efflux RND transporter periplasmic adaptor subunit [Chitinophagaceae bacterium]